MSKKDFVAGLPLDSARILWGDPTPSTEESAHGDFTWTPCEACGEAGDQREYTVIVTDEHFNVPKDDEGQYDVQICDACRYEAAYGIGSYES